MFLFHYKESKASNPEPMLYESVLEMDLSSVKDSHGYFQLEPFSASLSIPSPVNGIYESFSMESQNDQNQVCLHNYLNVWLLNLIKYLHV